MTTKETKKLDTLSAEKCKDRAGWQCEYCGKYGKGLNYHHIYSRTCYALRWDLENLIALCPKHHTLGTQFSAHKTPQEFMEWLADKRDIDYLKRIKQAYESITDSPKPKLQYDEVRTKLLSPVSPKSEIKKGKSENLPEFRSFLITCTKDQYEIINQIVENFAKKNNCPKPRAVELMLMEYATTDPSVLN